MGDPLFSIRDTERQLRSVGGRNWFITIFIVSVTIPSLSRRYTDVLLVASAFCRPTRVRLQYVLHTYHDDPWIDLALPSCYHKDVRQPITRSR